MNIHLKYAEFLLRKKLVHSVHIWNFCETKEDEKFLLKYLESIENDETLVFEYFEIPAMSTNLKTMAGARESGHLWKAYYEHYSNSAEYDDEDILIKADDDIVFVDVDKFDDFLANIQTAHVYFPNIVNNDAGLYVQGSRKAHQNATDCLEEFAREEADFKYNVNHYYVDDIQASYEMSMKKVYPLSGSWNDAWIMQGSLADGLHEGFLENPQQFIAACANVSYPRMVSVKQRISFNMFAGKMAMIKKLFGTFLEYQCCDFEGYLGKWPSLTHLDHLIDSHFTVVHYAFNMQFGTDTKDLNRFVSQYEALAPSTTTTEKEEDRRE